jgi:tetratricopeptide (TPR) repeat protein
MLLWSRVNDDVIRSLIAAAALLVALGLVRAWRARRRYQLVIPDMDQAGGSSTVVVGISPQLRQQVYRIFNSPGAPGGASLVTTVGKDITAGVVDLRTRVKDIPRLQLDIMAAPRDEIGMLAGGIRAVSPDGGEGLVGALSAVLPVQRGSTIQPMIQAREWGGLRQLGLTLDAGPIDRAHHASATFWAISPPSGTNGAEQSDRDQILELLRPAAIWISIYLVAGSLPIRHSHRLSFDRIFHRKDLSDEVDALRAILAAQLATYEMFWYSAKPLIALGFSDQALNDVDHAMRTLDSYFRPHYIAGTIHELRGDALIALKDLLSSANDAADTAFSNSYARQAAKSFDEAHKEFDRALTLLNHPTGTAAGYADELRHDFHVRSLKAALRGPDPSRALSQVLGEEIAWTSSEQHYNIACLYAVASVVADDLGRGGQELAMQSRSHLVAVINEDPTFANIIKSDPDLLSAFNPDDLHEIAQRAHSATTPKLPA